jgi:hypothetical protein
MIRSARVPASCRSRLAILFIDHQSIETFAEHVTRNFPVPMRLFARRFQQPLCRRARCTLAVRMAELLQTPAVSVQVRELLKGALNPQQMIPDHLRRPQ